MNPVLQVLLVLLVAGLSVWLRVVRPIRGDLAGRRRGERLARARAGRLARRRAEAPAS